ncbi:MAG: hypothetical protein KGJ55_05850 [Gammaproteobacteria bacterium]|nr:hypothetical protein [Gammaproteobacteria bacterium]
MLAIGLAGLVSVGSSAAGSVAKAPLPLERIARIVLPGRPARFDYQSLDAEAGRLYLNQMGAGRLLVFDVRKRRLVAALGGFADATGVLAVPSPRRVFVSSPGDLWDKAIGGGRVIAVDGATLERLGAVDVGRFPDGLSFVPKLNRVFVSDEIGGELSVFDARTLRSIGNVPLGGEAGMNAYDPKGDHVWVNDQSNLRLLAVNPKTLVIAARIELPATCRHNHGLLLDALDRLAFIGCDSNARLLLFDLARHAVQGVYRVGKDPDVMAYDSRRRLLYVASESGVVSLFRLRDGRLAPLGRAWLGDNAHSVSVDPASGESYFPIRDDHGHSALWIERPVGPALSR